MCSVSAGLQLIGGGISAAGALSGGQASSRSLMLQAMVAQQNAALAVQRGNFEANRVGEQVAGAEAGQVASEAARGLDPMTGSPLVMQGLTAAQGETDQALARAAGYQDAASQEWAAYGAATKADDARRAANYGAATAILSSVGKAVAPKSPGGGDAFSFT